MVRHSGIGAIFPIVHTIEFTQAPTTCTSNNWYTPWKASMQILPMPNIPVQWREIITHKDVIHIVWTMRALMITMLLCTLCYQSTRQAFANNKITLAQLLLDYDADSHWDVIKALGEHMTARVDNSNITCHFSSNKWKDGAIMLRMVQEPLIGCRLCSCCWIIKWAPMCTPPQPTQTHQTPHPAPPWNPK